MAEKKKEIHKAVKEMAAKKKKTMKEEQAESDNTKGKKHKMPHVDKFGPSSGDSKKQPRNKGRR